MKYTAEEVRAQAQKELHNGLYTVTWGMLTAYADLLERIKADEGAMPAYWAAIGEKEPDGSGGEIVLAYPADDGNDGEAARTECNQYINDAMLNERVRLRLVPLFTYPPAQAAQVPTRIAPHTQPAERVVEGCARYIDTGNARWDSAAFQAWREGSNPGSHAWIKRIRELLTAAQKADR